MMWPFNRTLRNSADGKGFSTGTQDRWLLPPSVEQRQLQLATAWACIRLTAMAVSSLPKKMYVKTANGREEVSDHNLAAVLCRDPNIDQTELEFWETMTAGLVAKGNAYALKTTTAGFLSAIRPVDAKPRRVNGDLRYLVNDRGRTVELSRDDVFHLKGFSFNGDVGLSPVQCGVQSFNAALNADEAASSIFENGLQNPLFIDSGKAKLTPEQRSDLRDMFTKFRGAKNSGKVLILEQGMTPKELTLNPEDAQMLETRRFNVEEICRWYGVPPIIVGHAAQGQTMWGSGVEQIMLAWLATGINPICRRIEQRISKQLISPKDRDKFYVEFNREGLLQMDTEAKSAFLSSMTQNGLMTRNEGRAKLNLPHSSQAGADDLTVQTALTPLDALGRLTAKKQ